MSGWKDMGTGARALAAVGGAAVIVAAGALIFRGERPAPEPVETAEPAPAGTVTQPPAASVAPPAPEAAPLAAPVPPAFDVVRVTPEGDALVAGRAAAGAEVSVKIDGVATARAVADPQGKFVAMFTLPPSNAPRVVQLSMQPATGAEIASADEVILAPTPQTAAAEPAPAATAEAETGESGTATAATGSAQTDAASTEVADAAAPEPAPGAPQSTTAEPSTAEAAVVSGEEAAPTGDGASTTAVLVTDSGAKVLQGAAGLPDNVTIGAISYSATGAVQLSGRGKAGAPLRLYLDNAPVLETAVGADGSWSGTLSEVEPGIYTLRADQLDAAGGVASRYETPFQREAPDALAALRTKSGKPVNITVQPGFTLWEIAKENYGDGVMFVRVFEANKAQIKDPDLIYPGQVFTVPKKD